MMPTNFNDYGIKTITTNSLTKNRYVSTVAHRAVTRKFIVENGRNERPKKERKIVFKKT